MALSAPADGRPRAAHLYRYLPGIAMRLLSKIGPKRVAALKAGKSGYDYKFMNARGEGSK